MDDPSSGQDERVDQLWAKLDTRKRGQLDYDALKKGLSKLDHPLQNADYLLRDVMKTVDRNGDGQIQYHEFCAFVKNAEKELWTLFKSIDRDADNKLSKSELSEAFTSSGILVSSAKLDEFFARVDKNNDGVITFDEWRDFLLFVPTDSPGLKAVYSYFTASVKVNPEGDVQLSDETVEGLGTPPPYKAHFAFLLRLFEPIAPPRIRHRPPDLQRASPLDEQDLSPSTPSPMAVVEDLTLPSAIPDSPSKPNWLMAILPKPGYFLAGGIAGIVSRTTTAPLDRLKVYLIAQTGNNEEALKAAKDVKPVQATRHAGNTLVDACRALWRAGGIRSLFAGNGLNVVKVMPESAIKFGSYEASKRFLATLEGHGESTQIQPWTQFVAGGMGGIISQFFVYPIDTLKFRMQCETVEGGMRGNQLIAATAKKMWTAQGLRSFYRGLPMGLVGMFPYSAIDLGTFEYLKRAIMRYNAKKRGIHEDDCAPGSVATAAIGGFSGALGASLVYPLNLLRTRLQTQGTAQHPRRYTGIIDVTRQTLKGEGVRGLFKGLTPNLLKVVPAVSITYVVYENSKKALKLS